MGKLIDELEQLCNEYISKMNEIDFKKSDHSYYRGKVDGIFEALKLIDKYR